MPVSDENRIIPVFKVHTTRNAAKSRAAGRPIFDELEVCEIRFAANRQTTAVFPAHSISRYRMVDGVHEGITYAQRWPEQYKKFKLNHQQTTAGTPLEELPFLTEGKRRELKALSIYTAETLAALDGPELKTLGMGGREMKNQAVAYLDNAAGSANVTLMAAENAALREQMADLQRQITELAMPRQERADDTGPALGATLFDAMDDTDIKAWIKEASGNAPRGNPSRDTLIRMAEEIRIAPQSGVARVVA